MVIEVPAGEKVPAVFYETDPKPAPQQKMLDRIAAEFNETAELETTLPRRERLSVGIALVCRPWTFSATAALRRS